MPAPGGVVGDPRNPVPPSRQDDREGVGSHPLSRPAGPRAFFFIRHGETDYNRSGRLQGQLDVPLNALGERQAVEAGATLARLLARRGLDPAALPFVASPLLRTRTTARHVRVALGLAPEPFPMDGRLKELTFGSWENQTWDELKARVPEEVAARRRDLWSFVPPGGESYADLAARVVPWLAALGENAIVVAHGGIARVLSRLVVCVSEAEAPRREIHQGRVLVFEDGAAHWV